MKEKNKLWVLCIGILGIAMFLFREFPAPVQILGSVLILGGVFGYSRQEQKKLQ